MRPVSYRIEYRCEGARRLIEHEGIGAFETQEARVETRCTDEAVSLSVVPLAPIEIVSCSIVFEHAVSPDDRVLVNGYQSWTQTRELRPSERLRGVSHIPKPIMKRYLLDASGDYRFASYDERPGHFHGFTYAHVRSSANVSLLASLDETHGLTLIEADCSSGTFTATREAPLGALCTGTAHELACLAFLQGDEKATYDRWFQLAGMAPRPSTPLVGYTSWYRHYGDIDAAVLEHDLAGACDVLGTIETTGALSAFQIDDGYCKVGDWLSPDTQRFPEGLGALATRISDSGLVPGLWVAPFVCERDSALFSAHPDWLLRDESGAPVQSGSHWSGGYALDTLNEGVRAYVREVLGTVTKSWGFSLIKADFLYAACMLVHDGLNRGELMADAMGLLRSAVGEDCLIIGCGVPLASAFGIVDYCRIGSDVGLDWDGKPYMRLLDRERVSTKHSLENTLARAPLDGRAFCNDPDVFFLREDVALSVRQRAMLLDADAQHASVLFTSDDMGQWGEAERRRYERAVRELVERKRP